METISLKNCNPHVAVKKALSAKFLWVAVEATVQVKNGRDQFVELGDVAHVKNGCGEYRTIPINKKRGNIKILTRKGEVFINL